MCIHAMHINSIIIISESESYNHYHHHSWSSYLVTKSGVIQGVQLVSNVLANKVPEHLIQK